MENPEKNGFSPITIIILIAIVIIGGLWYSSKNHPVIRDVDAPSVATSTSSVSNEASSTQPVVENVTYKSEAHQFEFTYPNSWKTSTALNAGAYKDATVFVPVQAEATIAAADKKTSEQIKALAADQVLAIRIKKSNSINQTIQTEYGANIAVESRRVDGRELARVVHSKTTDPVNWQGGSTEAYLVRNSLGEIIIVEAAYGSEEIDVEGDLHTFLETVISSLKLKAI